MQEKILREMIDVGIHKRAKPMHLDEVVFEKTNSALILEMIGSIPKK